MYAAFDGGESCAARIGVVLGDDEGAGALGGGRHACVVSAGRGADDTVGIRAGDGIGGDNSRACSALSDEEALGIREAVVGVQDCDLSHAGGGQLGGRHLGGQAGGGAEGGGQRNTIPMHDRAVSETEAVHSQVECAAALLDVNGLNPVMAGHARGVRVWVGVRVGVAANVPVGVAVAVGVGVAVEVGVGVSVGVAVAVGVGVSVGVVVAVGAGVAVSVGVGVSVGVAVEVGVGVVVGVAVEVGVGVSVGVAVAVGVGVAVEVGVGVLVGVAVAVGVGVSVGVAVAVGVGVAVLVGVGVSVGVAVEVGVAVSVGVAVGVGVGVSVGVGVGVGVAVGDMLSPTDQSEKAVKPFRHTRVVVEPARPQSQALPDSCLQTSALMSGLTVCGRFEIGGETVTRGRDPPPLAVHVRGVRMVAAVMLHHKLAERPLVSDLDLYQRRPEGEGSRPAHAFGHGSCIGLTSLRPRRCRSAGHPDPDPADPCH